tara:strand:+ start:250 stop:426 length:177 start_codon:yes stop_codon:yes gene_type:complete
MKWEVKKIKEGKSKGKWGVFLVQKYCKTDEPVCYGVSIKKSASNLVVKRLNDPNYWCE